MTTISRRNMFCPACYRRVTMTVYQTINVTLDSSLREKVFSDAVNRHTCEHCGFQIIATACLLYHDMERKFFVWYLPNAADADTALSGQEFDALIRLYGEAPGVATEWDEFKAAILEKERTHPLPGSPAQKKEKGVT